MSKKAIIKLVDGAITDFDTDQYYVGGYETCDYSRSYVSDIDIYYQNKTMDRIRDDSNYCYGMSMADLMRVVLNYQEDIKKLKECEVAEFIKDKLESECDCIGLEII